MMNSMSQLKHDPSYITLALGLSSTLPHVLIIWHKHSRSSAKSTTGLRFLFSKSWKYTILKYHSLNYTSCFHIYEINIQVNDI